MWGYVSLRVFLTVFATLLCRLSSVSKAMHRSYISINQDGSIAAANQMPACDNGRIIHLTKITHYKRSCSSICLNIPSKKALAEVDGHLHEMCSYKERCTNMGYPLTTIQTHRITGLNVSYGCLDPTKNFVDICKKKATFFSSDIQLVATTTSSFKECRCFINGGKFTIEITDLRLRSKLGRNCSSSTLQIDSKDYDCSYPGYNDISSKTVKEDVSKTFISVSSANDDSSPMMVWLTLRPKDSSLCSVECHGIPRTSISVNHSGTRSTPVPKASNQQRYSASGQASSTDIKWSGLLIVASRVLLASTV